MQDRYAGDIGDFGKIGLLRALRAQGLSVGVNWYYVESLSNEKKSDGSYRRKDGKYIIPAKYQKCDKLLAQELTKIAQSSHRLIKDLERGHFVSEARYYRAPVTVIGRDEWHKKALEELKGRDIIFLDPDNGMLVKSVGKKSARSVKYTFYEEVGDYIKQRQSVLIYNHRSRKQEEEYFHEISCKLREATGVLENDILTITFPRCSVRDYFAIPATSEHRDKIEAAFISMEQGIWGETGMCRIPRVMCPV